MKILKTFKEETLLILPAVIYFFIAFNTLVLTKALMLKEYGIPYTGFATATVLSLILGKVVLITDYLPFINRYPTKPLIYNITWKTFIYLLVTLIVRCLEQYLEFAWDLGDFTLAYKFMRFHFVWSQFFLIQLWLLILIFGYTTFHELASVIGRDKILLIFFGDKEEMKKRNA